jgi:hypothetical protein
MRVAASTTQVPLFALFTLYALPNPDAIKSNNAKGGTKLAEAGGALQCWMASASPTQ